MQRTLLIHTGGIGDFLLACPAIAYLHEEGPVDILGRPDRAALAVAGNITECILDIDGIGFESILSEPSPKLRNSLRDYRRAIVFLRDDDSRLRDGLVACGIGDVQCFPGLPPEDWTGHVSDYYLDCIEQTEAPARFSLNIPPDDSCHDLLIHPGSGGKTKNWPLGNFLVLAEHLRTEGREIAWILGPAELENPEFDTLYGGNRHRVIEIESLVELAAQLAGARAYIGNDSGITHLAAVVGCPTVALFGPTDPNRWAPIGPQVNVLRWEQGVAGIIAGTKSFLSR